MYQPYPSGGQVPEPQRPEPPSPVLTAVKLMYAGAVLSAIIVVVTLLTVGSVRTAIHNAYPHYSSTRVHSAAMGLVVIEVIIWVVTMGLWLWMAVKNRVGRGWARITATVLFGLLLFLLMWLIGLGAILMLWRKESSAYFAAARQP